MRPPGIRDGKGRISVEHGDAYYTLKGYQRMENEEFTPAMEDYLEMICRILQKQPRVRLRDLAENLNVRPSSGSKMVRQLHALGYLRAERYGDITLTEKGLAAGSYLLYRHEVVYRFLRYLNGTPDPLEEAEKIEHFLSRETVAHLDTLLRRLTAAPEE